MRVGGPPGGVCPAKSRKILQNLGFCPAKLHFQVGEYVASQRPSGSLCAFDHTTLLWVVVHMYIVYIVVCF